MKCDEGLRSLVASYFEEYMQDVLDGGKQGSAHFTNVVRTTCWSEFCLPSAKLELQQSASAAGCVSSGSSSSIVHCSEQEARAAAEPEAQCFWKA